MTSGSIVLSAVGASPPHVEGQSIILEPRWAEGKHERLPGLLADLVRLNVDVIVAAATPASRAAKAATATIPIVIVAVGEPVRVGLVASLVRPGGNVTGLGLLTPDLSGKRLELLLEIAGKVSRVAILMNPDNAVSVKTTQGPRTLPTTLYGTAGQGAAGLKLQ